MKNKGWYGNKQRHSCASKGIRTKIDTYKSRFSNDDLRDFLRKAQDILNTRDDNNNLDYNNILNKFTYKEIDKAYAPYLEIWVLINEGRIKKSEIPNWYNSDEEELIGALHYEAQEKLRKIFPELNLKTNKSIINKKLIKELGKDFDERETEVIDVGDVLSRDGFNIVWKSNDGLTWNADIVKNLGIFELEVYT